jgi:hypothetical protein
LLSAFRSSSSEAEAPPSKKPACVVSVILFVWVWRSIFLCWSCGPSICVCHSRWDRLNVSRGTPALLHHLDQGLAFCCEMVEIWARIWHQCLFGGCMPCDLEAVVLLLRVIVLFVKHYSSI